MNGWRKKWIKEWMIVEPSNWKWRTDNIAVTICFTNQRRTFLELYNISKILTIDHPELSNSWDAHKPCVSPVSGVALGIRMNLSVNLCSVRAWWRSSKHLSIRSFNFRDCVGIWSIPEIWFQRWKKGLFEVFVKALNIADL